MIRRSTLVFLTCLGTLGIPAMSAEVGAVDGSVTDVLVAQSSEPATANVLSIGSRGRAVRTLQNQLEESGYYDGPVDGIYGLATQRAVLAFQEDQGFEPTGRLDDETWAALEAFEEQTAATAPTEDEPVVSPVSPAPAEDLPPVGEPATAVADGAGDARGSVFGRVMGLGIGLAAVLASFGVGFFIANRNKSEDEAELLEGEEWSEAALDAEVSTGGATVASSPRNNTPSFGAASSNGFATTQNGAVTGGVAAGNGSGAGAGGGGAMAKAVAQERNGQLGGTSAMTKSDIFDGLIKDLHNPDPHKRRKVIWELGQRGNSLAVQPLVDAMIDADSKEKSLVLAALSEIGMRSLRPMNRALAIALQDDNPEVRKNAIRDLTRIYELVVQISQMLSHAQEDEDPEVRQTASWALEQLNRIRQTQDLDSNMRSLPTNGPKTNRFAL